MSYVATIDFAGQTMDDYWPVQQGYADEPIDGLVGQVAGRSENGLRVVSMWQSKAHHDRFVAERLYPIFERLGSPTDMVFSDFTAEDLLLGRASRGTDPVPQLLPGAPEAANRMYAMILGYWTSQISGVLARFGIPDLLAVRAQNAAELAAAIDCRPDPLFRLLRAAASVGILAMAADGAFSLTPVGATLRSDAPGSLRGLACALTTQSHWLPWGHLDDAVRSGECPAPTTLGSNLFGYLLQHPGELAEFTEAMQDLSAMIVEPVARLLDLSAAKDVVDVGGGSGTLLAALLERNPAVHGIVLERPEVAPAARALMSARGLSGRCDVVEGDFFDAVPEADVHILKLIVHDWDDGPAAAILRNCATSLRPGGKIVLVEAVVPEDGSQPLLPLLDLNMHVVLGGRERTATEHGKLLGAAGLRLDRIIETRSHGQIIEASLA